MAQPGVPTWWTNLNVGTVKMSESQSILNSLEEIRKLDAVRNEANIRIRAILTSSLESIPEPDTKSSESVSVSKPVIKPTKPVNTANPLGPATPPAGDPTELTATEVLSVITNKQSYSLSDVCVALEADKLIDDPTDKKQKHVVSKLLKELVDVGKLTMTGEKRGTRYTR
jgi:hypothetical protein